jgi:hypothetical protein
MKIKFLFNLKSWFVGFSCGQLDGISTKYFAIHLGPAFGILEWNPDPMQLKIEL